MIQFFRGGSVKKTKAFFIILICLVALLSACASQSVDTQAEKSIDAVLKDMEQCITIMDREGFMRCIDRENMEFYAEELHMFQDIEKLDIKDFRLSRKKLTIIDDITCSVELTQSCKLDGNDRTINFKGVFRKSGTDYKFSDIYFDTIYTNHFIIKYSPSLKKQAEAIISPAEEGYQTLKKVYGNVPSGKTVIKLYDDNEVFNWFIKPSIGFKMGGWYEYPESIKVNMCPEILSRYDDVSFNKRFLDVLSHELTHRTNMEESGNNIPYWMAEGIATYVQNGGALNLSPPENSIEQLETINLEKLTKSEDISRYYSDSYKNVSEIINKFGIGKLHEILLELKKYPLQEKTGGESIKESNERFHKVLESSMSMTVKQFDEYLLGSIEQ